MKIFINKKETDNNNPEIIPKKEADNSTSTCVNKEDDEINIYYLPQKIIKAIKIAMKDFAIDHRLNLKYEPNKSAYRKIFDIVNSLITRENVVKFFRTIFETEEEVVLDINFPNQIIFERKNASFVIEKIILSKEDGCRCGVEIVSKLQKKQQSP